jgi:hypothetical protein
MVFKYNAMGCFLIEFLMYRLSKRHLTLDVFSCCLLVCVDKLYQFQLVIVSFTIL